MIYDPKNVNLFYKNAITNWKYRTGLLMHFDNSCFIKMGEKNPAFVCERRGSFYHTPKLTAYIFAIFLNVFHLLLSDFNTIFESAFSKVI